MELDLVDPGVHLCAAVRREQVLGSVCEAHAQHVLLLVVVSGDLRRGVVQRERRRGSLLVVIT